jgi:predicted amidohydrolase YtcJ
MFTQSRREFLGSLGVFALSLKYVEPQLVLYNGNVITVDSRPLATARTVKINLEGKTVLPGFIDAHSHPAYSGLTHLREVDADLRSIH